MKMEKMIPVESIPGMGEGDRGELMEKINSSMIYVRTFVNATMYPHPAQQQQQKS
jgi:hypothetical protein